jgi:hypothetical protein
MGKIIRILGCGLNLAGGAQSVERAAIREGREESHRPASVGDLDGLALLDKT